MQFGVPLGDKAFSAHRELRAIFARVRARPNVWVGQIVAQHQDRGTPYVPPLFRVVPQQQGGVRDGGLDS